MTLISEAMLLVDHPKEPMTLRVQFRLSALPADHPLWDPVRCRAATLRILARHPELLRTFHLARDGLRVSVTSPHQHESLAAALWDYPPQDTEWSPDVSKPPLLRFQLTPADGICIVAHHALLDGRSALALIHELLAEIVGSPELPPTGAQYAGPQLRDLLRPRVLAELTRSVYAAWRQPPLLLGEEQHLFGTRHMYLDASLPKQALTAIHRGARARVADCMLNDVLLAALHLALDDLAQAKRQTQRAFGGLERISVMVPMDLRRRAGVTELTNLSASVCVDSSPVDRADSTRLLIRVHDRMAHVKRYHLEHASILRLACLRWFGVLRRARRIKVESGLPRRASEGAARFWKRVSTALFTNMGNVRFSRDIAPLLRTIEGCAPVLPPMGVALSSAVLAESLFLYLRASDATLSPDEARFLMDRWASRLLEFRADGLSSGGSGMPSPTQRRSTPSPALVA